MKVLTINELMRLTRAKLCSLAARIAAKLPTYREGSSSTRHATFTTLSAKVSSTWLRLDGVGGFSYARSSNC